MLYRNKSNCGNTMNDICMGAADVNKQKEMLLIKGKQRLSILKLRENTWYAKRMDTANMNNSMQEWTKPDKNKQTEKNKKLQKPTGFLKIFRKRILSGISQTSVELVLNTQVSSINKALLSHSNCDSSFLSSRNKWHQNWCCPTISPRTDSYCTKEEISP